MHTVPDLLVSELRSHEQNVSIAEELLRERKVEYEESCVLFI